MQHQAGVKLAVLIFGVGLTPLGVNTKSKIARFGTFFVDQSDLLFDIF